MSSQRRVAQAPVLSRGDSPETQAVVRQGTRGKIDARAAETIEKLEKAQIKNAGALTFPNTDKKPAKFAKMPPIKEKAAVDKAIDVLTDVWKLPRASVLISVTGGAQAFSSADTYSLEPPYGTYGLRVPTSCVVCVPEAQGSLPRAGTPYAYQPRACRKKSRAVWCTTGLQPGQAAHGVLPARAEGGGAYDQGVRRHGRHQVRRCMEFIRTLRLTPTRTRTLAPTSTPTPTPTLPPTPTPNQVRLHGARRQDA